MGLNQSCTSKSKANSGSKTKRKKQDHRGIFKESDVLILSMDDVRCELLENRVTVPNSHSRSKTLTVSSANKTSSTNSYDQIPSSDEISHSLPSSDRNAVYDFSIDRPSDSMNSANGIQIINSTICIREESTNEGVQLYVMKSHTPHAINRNWEQTTEIIGEDHRYRPRSYGVDKMKFSHEEEGNEDLPRPHRSEALRRNAISHLEPAYRGKTMELYYRSRSCKGKASIAFTPNAVASTALDPVTLVCISAECGIYVCDIGLSVDDYEAIIQTSEVCSQGHYAAYTYAKQTIGCREHDELASVCEAPVMIACRTIREALTKENQELVLDDREPHIVKYDVSKRERQKLDMHTDKSEWTFLIALSSEGYNNDYTGGGTFFEKLNATIHLQQGQALIFPGRLRHRGEKITKGQRFLLVGFLVDQFPSDTKSSEIPK